MSTNDSAVDVGARQRRGMRRLDAAFLTLLLVYVGLQAKLGRFLELDEVFFKAAGREWAASGHFAAVEIEGFPSLDEREFQILDPPLSAIWFPQPPVYTFLFGVFTKLCGFGPRQCIVFDALIHALLAWLTYRLARRFALPGALVFLAGSAVLPLGTIARPDELAMCFGMAGLLVLVRTPISLKRAASSGSLFGLSAGTTAGAAVLLAIVAGVLLLSLPVQRRDFSKKPGFGVHPEKGWSWRRCFLVLVWGLAAMALLTTTIAPILLYHPDAYKQYATHASWHFGGGNYLESYLRVWRSGKNNLALTLGGLVTAGACLRRSASELGGMHWGQWWLGPILGVGFLAVFLPSKSLYLWFMGPWMLVAALVSLRARASPSLSHPGAGVRGPRAPLRVAAKRARLPPWRFAVMVLVAAYAMAAFPFVRNTFVMFTLPPDQSLWHNAALIRQRIPRGSLVLTDDYWWALADDCRVRDIYFARPQPDEIDYIILLSNGNPDCLRSVPPYLSEAVTNGYFIRTHDNLNRHNVQIGGWTLPDSAYGFGALVLGRAQQSAMSEQQSAISPRASSLDGRAVTELTADR